MKNRTFKNKFSHRQEYALYIAEFHSIMKCSHSYDIKTAYMRLLKFYL